MFILHPSFILSPDAPVFPSFSLPARSIKFIIDIFSVFFPSITSFYLKSIVIMVWALNIKYIYKDLYFEPRRACVHKGCANSPVSSAFLNFLINRFVWIYGVFCQILDINSKYFVFSNLEATFRSLVMWDKQVLNIFIIDLLHWYLNFKRFIFVLIWSDPSKNLVARNRNDTL